MSDVTSAIKIVLSRIHGGENGQKCPPTTTSPQAATKNLWSADFALQMTLTLAHRCHHADEVLGSQESATLFEANASVARKRDILCLKQPTGRYSVGFTATNRFARLLRRRMSQSSLRISIGFSA